jgi:GxxExxY protein
MTDNVNALTEAIIGCALRVHRALGLGLQEQTYEAAMAIALRDSGSRSSARFACR